MTHKKLRLMLLSVGSLGAQGMIDALEERRRQCVVIGTNSIAEVAGNFRSDVAYLVPPAASGEAYRARLAELIDAEQPDLVIPTRDDDALALAALSERSPSKHAVLLAGSVAAARMMNDKLETARFAQRHGLPFAPTAGSVREALELAEAGGLPLIGKPRSGNGARGVVLLRSRAEIERAFELESDLIAQPYLDPPSNMADLSADFETGLPFFFSFPEKGHHTVQIMIALDGRISEPFAGVNTAVGGRAAEYRRSDDPDLLEVTRAYARAAAAEGWRGPMNVQLKRTPGGGFVAFELNARFSGGAAARIHLGFDEIGELVRWFLPGRAFPQATALHADLVQRYLRSYPLPREGLATLRTTGRWSRAEHR